MVIVGFFCGCLAGIGVSYALYVYHMKTVVTKHMLSKLSSKELLKLKDDYNHTKYIESLQYVLSKIDSELYSAAKSGYNYADIYFCETGHTSLSCEDKERIAKEIELYLKDRGDFKIKIQTDVSRHYARLCIEW